MIPNYNICDIKKSPDSVFNAIGAFLVCRFYFSTSIHCPFVLTKKSLSYMASACTPYK